MKNIMHRVSLEEEMYELNKYNYNTRPTLREVHLSDVHLGVSNLNIEEQYKILDEQFLQKIEKMEFDILSINGDLLDHRFMGNSPVINYACLFISRCVNRCKEINATFILMDGTLSHDDGQLFSLFAHYTLDKTVDFRLITKVQFEYIKGAKILCIPEMYNMGKEYYDQFLFKSGYYDGVFMHGMFKGAVYQEEMVGTDSTKAPTFCIEDFKFCLGPIISGHVHIPGCFNKYFYYTGSPLRFRHGEEQEKGFLILLHNLNDNSHYVHFETIKSFRFDTIYLDDIINLDINQSYEYINKLKESGIYNLRIKFNKALEDKELNNLNILKNYYRRNKYINFDYDNNKKKEEDNISKEIEEKYKDYEFLFDDKLSNEEKFVMYVNKNEECEFITVDEFRNILEND